MSRPLFEPTTERGAIQHLEPASYNLSWWTVDGGGGTVNGGAGYALGGTVRQPDAGLLTGASGYALLGGFWSGAVWRYRVYLPLVLRANP